MGRLTQELPTTATTDHGTTGLNWAAAHVQSRISGASSVKSRSSDSRQEAVIGGRISISAKRLGLTLLALVVFVFIWDEITAHPWGPLLYFCVETGDGCCNRGWVAVHWPDTETSFGGKEGYAWQIKPISISGSQAVIDFRAKHFDHFVPAADMRAQLEQSEFRRLIVRPEQPPTVEAADGVKLSLTY